MEIEDLKRDSARLTWLIDESLNGRQHLDASVKREFARHYIDLMMAQAKLAETNADAERARWCVENAASVLHDGKWSVDWLLDGSWHTASDPDRNSAIDKARAVVK